MPTDALQPGGSPLSPEHMAAIVAEIENRRKEAGEPTPEQKILAQLATEKGELENLFTTITNETDEHIFPTHKSFFERITARLRPLIARWRNQWADNAEILHGCDVLEAVINKVNAELVKKDKDFKRLQAIQELQSARNKLTEYQTRLKAADSLNAVNEVAEDYQTNKEAITGQIQQALARVPAAGLDTDPTTKIPHNKLIEDLDQFEKEIIREREKMAVKEAKEKLEEAHKWLDTFEGELAGKEVLTVEEFQDFDKRFGEVNNDATGNPAAKAKQFIKEHGLANNDEIRGRLAPDDRGYDGLLKREEEIEEKIQELNRERIRREVAETIKKAEDFVVELQKRPPEVEFDQVKHNIVANEAEWQRLTGEIGQVIQTAWGDKKVREQCSDELKQLQEFVDIIIPLELAKTAIGFTEATMQRTQQEWEAIKTIDALEQKIKRDKDAFKRINVRLPKDELVEDSDVDLWVKVFTDNIYEEIRRARNFVQRAQQIPGVGQGEGFQGQYLDFAQQAKNFEKNIRDFEIFFEKKKRELIESKHRKRVREQVTSENVQKGEAKARIGFGEGDEEFATSIDIKEIKKEEVIEQIIKTLLRTHTFGDAWAYGKEKEGTRQTVQSAEVAMIRRIQETFGHGTDWGFTPEQCEDLFYAAKQWVWNRAVMDTEGTTLEQMQVVPRGGGIKAGALSPEERKKKQKAKGLFGTIARGLGLLGFGGATTVGLSVLAGPFGALAGLAITGGVRMLDVISQSQGQLKKINKWKQEVQKDPGLKDALAEHLAFIVANLKENQTRAGVAHQNYEDYYERAKDYYVALNNRERRWSEVEVQKIAAADAVYREIDDAIERERIDHELNRDPNTRHWWNRCERIISTSLRRRPGRLGWKMTSPRERFYAGATSLGVSLGIFGAREWLPAGGRLAARLATGGYTGWQWGGAVVDKRVGRHSPEEVSEYALVAIEEEVKNLEGLVADKKPEEALEEVISPLIQELAELRAVLNAIHNPIEYARQKERWKKLFMPVIAEKIWLEQVAKELDTNEKILAAGQEISENEIRAFYEERRDAEAADALRRERTRMWGRIGGMVAGAASTAVLGYYGDKLLEHLFGPKGSGPSGHGPEKPPPPPPPGGGRPGAEERIADFIQSYEYNRHNQWGPTGPIPHEAQIWGELPVDIARDALEQMKKAHYDPAKPVTFGVEVNGHPHTETFIHNTLPDWPGYVRGTQWEAAKYAVGKTLTEEAPKNIDLRNFDQWKDWAQRGLKSVKIVKYEQ